MKASTWAIPDKRAAVSPAPLEAKPTGEPGDIVVPEETMFGVVSRYHALSAHPTSGDTLTELLNRRSVALGTSFPSGLHLISKYLQLPVSTIGELIEAHTVLPCFKPFMNSIHYKRIAHLMANGTASNTKIALGLLASRVGAEDVLCFCPTCAQADRETIGVATWYRAHQFPGVFMCPYHGVPLVAYYCLAQRFKRHQLFLPTEAEKWIGQQSVPKFDELACKKLLHISRLVAQLLTLRSASIDSLAWRNQYLAHLMDRGLATTSLRVRQRALQNELLDFWAPIRTLPVFNSIFARCNGDDSWLTSLYRRPRSTHHPLLHILLTGFLTESIESFLSIGISFPAITSAPHRRASAALEDKVAALATGGRSMRQVAKELGLTVNTVLVKAEKIGVDYMRRSKKVNTAVRVQVQRALAAGDAISEIVSTTELSASTVNRILGAQRDVQTQRAASLREKRQKDTRARLRAAKLASPSAGFKALQVALGADFVWLYRHDRAWLQAEVTSKPRIVSCTSPVNWGARDRMMIERVRRAVEEIIEPLRRPLRVSINEIGRRTGNASWLDKHLVQLPQTAKLLAEVLETTAVFRARRIAWCEKKTE